MANISQAVLVKEVDTRGQQHSGSAFLSYLRRSLAEGLQLVFGMQITPASVSTTNKFALKKSGHRIVESVLFVLC